MKVAYLALVATFCIVCSCLVANGMLSSTRKAKTFHNNVNGKLSPFNEQQMSRLPRNYAMCLDGEYHDPNNTYDGVAFCCDTDCVGTGGEFAQLFTPSRNQLPWRFTDVTKQTFSFCHFPIQFDFFFLFCTRYAFFLGLQMML